MTAYHEQLREKIRILRFLLDDFNDGRKKALFYTAVNLLELENLRLLLAPLEAARSSLSPREAAAGNTDAGTPPGTSLTARPPAFIKSRGTGQC